MTPDTLTDRESASASETRRRLLEAAGLVFAQKGYQAATIREICQIAGANVAAVNYHFGDKERLYHAVFVECFERAECRFPVCAPESAGSDPRLQLQHFIHNFMGRVLDPGKPAHHGKLMSREMAEPTGEMDYVFSHHIRPIMAELHRIVLELAGPAAPPGRVVAICHSIVGQCVFYCHAQPVLERFDPELHYDDARIAAIARHVTEFSLHAIAGIMAAEGAECTDIQDTGGSPAPLEKT